LGDALHGQGKVSEAMEAWREAIRLRPEDAVAHAHLGDALRGDGEVSEAIAAYREAIRLKPDYAEPHASLGAILCDVMHDYAAAVVEFHEAIRLRPDYAVAHYNLGNALIGQGKVSEAMEAWRDTIRLKPDYAEAHYNLGTALADQGKSAEAIEAWREAIRLKPDYAQAHCNLGSALQDQGQFREALDQLRRGHELGSKRPGWPYPSAEWVRRAERLVALESRLPAVLRGDDKPKDAAEELLFADLAIRTKRFGPSARLYAESLRADPKLAEDMKAQNRYNAACAAALAGAALVQDQPPLDEAEKARWRRQALEWLRADLAFWTMQSETGKPEAKALVNQILRHWKADTDLAGIRDETVIKTLSNDEQKACRALWAEVDTLLAKVRGESAVVNGGRRT
jgi:tetratricopeptide (TPR) repeat protein